MQQLKLEKWIEKHQQKVLIGSLLLFALFVIITFDAKVSIGGDDSGYITAAKSFLEGSAFPNWHGSFYPIFLAPFIALVGINVIFFKFLSVLLVGAQVYLLAKSFKQRIPWLIWAFTVALAAINMQMVNYASTTYSEPLFLLMQAAVLFFFYKIDSVDLSQRKASALQFLLFGCSTFLLALTRNVGFGVVVAIFLYFLFRKEFIKAGLSVVSFLVFQLPFGLYKKYYWHINSSGISNQFNNMAYKHFYDHKQGTEDFWGFVQRFWDNSELYISKHLMRFLGFHGLESNTTSTFVTILFFALFLGVSIYFIARKKNVFLFLGLYLAVLISGTFISQQKHWDQERLILIYLPVICVYLGSGIYYFLQEKKGPYNRIFASLLILILLLNVKNNVERSDFEQVTINLGGDKFYGYTPDWENYLKMCAWAGKNVAKDQHIMARKPEMAQIYGNREYEGLYKVPTSNPDSMRAYFKKHDIDYVIVASLRTKPQQYTGRVITTIRNSLAIMLQKYPYSLEYVHAIGNRERAILYKVHLEEERLSMEERIQRLDSWSLIVSNSVAGNYYLAYYYYNHKQLEKALKHIQVAVKLEKKKPEPLLTLQGNIYFAMEKYTEASQSFLSLLQKNDKDKQAWYNLGLCYQRMNNPEYRVCFANAEKLGFKVPQGLK